MSAITPKAPMSRLSHQTVRTSWPAYLGAFIALVTGVVLIATTINLVGSVDATLSTGVTQEQRQELDGLTSMFGMMSAVSLFLAIFVVGSTFGFVVATRRRELGLLRLIGATGRQIRRLVLGESTVVALAAVVVGCLIATTLASPVLTLFRRITEQHLVAPAPWLAWAIAAPTGMVVALMGAWRSSRRAAKVPPSAALREAAVERGRPSIVQWIVGTLCLATVVAAVVLARKAEALFALVASILLPEVMVIGLMCFGTLLVPRLAALLARPFIHRDVAARLARDELRAAVRTTTSVAAPVIAISAVAGSMLLALSFTADWTSAQDRAHLHAPLVVQPGAGHDVAATLSADPSIRLIDERHTLTVALGGEGFDQIEVDAVDVPTATAARGLSTSRGDLTRLHRATAAVSETWVSDSGTGLGGHIEGWIGGQRVDLNIVAIVPDAPDLYGEVLLPADLVADELDGSPATELFVVLKPEADVAAVRASLDHTLTGTGSEVLTADEWIDAVTYQVRQSNNFGLMIVLGPAAFYAAIAVVNATLIGATQRRHPHEALSLLGATRDQLRRTALWQAAVITGAGLVLGGMTTAFLGWLVRLAVTTDLAGTGEIVPMTVPWLPLIAIALACGALALAAAGAGVRGSRSLATASSSSL
jgi:predicted lysophospholipase L1 biosynthesis ABC-type transport system permease subunit